jgi:glycosyltransferase involved in cell wall biosynthesis
VHDWLYGGGAEKVVEQLHKIYPKAPIYTSFCTDEWRKRLDNKVVTGYLQNWPFSKMRKFLPLLRQWWFAGIDLNEFDLIISSSGNGEAKFITKPEGATHIGYCHSPPHFYWRKYQSYLKNPGFGKLNFLARFGLKILAGPLRKKDYLSAQKVDYFIANSSHIQNDIKQFYGRDSVVIYPPVSVEKFKKVSHKGNSKSKPKFIVWGRHVPYKRIDLAVSACTKLGYKLTVIGEGPETENLKRLAGPTVNFAGWTTDEQIIKLASEADAFIFTTIDDFGIAPVEALSAGLPVIAYKAGGALDYVIEGKTGTFFNEQADESLVEALKSFDPKQYNSKEIQEFAQKFSEKEFKKNISKFISSKVE